MGEILFRGKRSENGAWIEGHYFKNENGTFIFTFPYHANYAGIDVMVKVHPETVCQYTEVDDKNGTNIFHKDIVSAPFIGYGGKKHARIGVVEYVKGAFCVNWNDSEEYGKNFLGYVNDIEVIGNVFDNPELIGSD